MQVALPLIQTLITHIQGLLGYNISEFCGVVLKKYILKVCIKLVMLKLSLAIISRIMYVAAPFEQTLIRQAQELFVCKI